jgi:hypothetical protein
VDAPPAAPPAAAPACAVWIGAVVLACATVCFASSRCTDCANAALTPSAQATAIEIFVMRIMHPPFIVLG